MENWSMRTVSVIAHEHIESSELNKSLSPEF